VGNFSISPKGKILQARNGALIDAPQIREVGRPDGKIIPAKKERLTKLIRLRDSLNDNLP